MDLTGNTVLITGGASGIGLALRERFLQAGSQVIVCGRRGEKLREVKAWGSQCPFEHALREISLAKLASVI